MIARLSRLLTQTGAALLVVGFFVVVGALFTPTGSLELLKKLAESTPGLELTYRKGTLSDGVVLDRLFWRAPNGSTIAAKDLDAGWNMTCWSQKVICLRETTIDQITINLPPARDHNDTTIVLPDIKIPVPIEARSLKINHLKIIKPGNEPVTFKNIRLSAFWLRHEIKFSSLQLNWKDTEFVGDGSIELKERYPLEFSLGLQTPDPLSDFPLTANATLAGNVTAIELNASASLPFNLQTFGTIYPFDPAEPLQGFHLRWQDAQWPLTTEPDIRSATGAATFSGNYERVKIIGNAELAHTALPDSTLKIDGILNRSGIEVKSGELNLLGGTIDLNGIVGWNNAIDWNMQVNLSNVSPAPFWPIPVTAINASAFYSGRFENHQLQLGLSKLAGNLRYNDRPVSIVGGLQMDANDNWHFDHFLARSRNSEVRLNGTLGERSSATASLSVDVAELLPAAGGNLYGRIDISGSRNTPDISGRLRSDQFSFEQTQFNDATVDFNIGELLKNQSRVELNAQQFSQVGHTFNALQLNFDGKAHDHHITATATSRTLGELAVALSGQLSEWRTWSGSLSSASASPDDYSVDLAAPVSMTYSQQNTLLSLEPHCWKFNETSLCIDEQAQLGKTGNISFHSENLNLSPLSAVLPDNLILAGNVDSRGHVAWDDAGRPVVTLSSAVREAELIIDQGPTAVPLSLDFENVELQIDTRQGVILTRLGLYSRQLGTVSSTASIDTLTDGYPITGTMKLANADIRWLQRFMTDVRQLRGTANGDLQFSGSLSMPTVRGVVALDATSFSSDQLPTPVSDLTAQIKIAGNRATFNGSAIAADAPIEFSGLAARDDNGLALDTRLAASGITVSNEFVDDANLDAAIRIQMANSQLETTGKVTLNTGTIRFGDDPGGGLQHSNDIIVLQEISASSEPPPAILRVSAGIDVVLGDSVNFRGWGLNTKLSGSLRAHLFSDKPPQVAGEITIDHGTYRSYGQDLTIRNGKIHFIGPPGQAALSAEAVRQQDTLTAGLRLEGSIQAPTATLFSEPALPDEEILSYLVLGRSLDDRSDRQAQLLANAALYVGLRNGQVLSDRIADIFGIEDFYVTATGSGDHTQLMVSGRLTNRLLLRYGIGIFTPINTLYLRYDLAERLYVESTRGIERAVDLYYSFEF